MRELLSPELLMDILGGFPLMMLTFWGILATVELFDNAFEKEKPHR